MREVTIGELAREGSLTFSDGYRTKQAELDPTGIPILRVAEVHDGQLAPTGSDRVSERFRAKFASKTSQPGDVVLTTKGTVGRVALVEPHHPEFVYSPQTCFFRARGRGLSGPFLYYWFRGSEFRQQARSRQGQTDMAAYLNLADISTLRITLPAPPIQGRIADVLGALDDKADSNRKVVEVAIDLAATLVAQATLDARGATANVSSVADFHNRKRIPLSAKERSQMSGDVPYFGATGIVGFVNQHLFDEPIVLVGEDGSVVHDDGTPYVQYVWGPSWVNNHAHVLTGRGISTELLYLLLRTADVRPAITGAVQAKLSMRNLKTVAIRVPRGDQLQSVESEIAPLVAAVCCAEEQSRTLAALRDALLPELLSGRLRVAEAEDLVADAG